MILSTKPGTRQNEQQHVPSLKPSITSHPRPEAKFKPRAPWGKDKTWNCWILSRQPERACDKHFDIVFFGEVPEATLMIGAYARGDDGYDLAVQTYCDIPEVEPECRYLVARFETNLELDDLAATISSGMAGKLAAFSETPPNFRCHSCVHIALLVMEDCCFATRDEAREGNRFLGGHVKGPGALAEELEEESKGFSSALAAWPAWPAEAAWPYEEDSDTLSETI